MNLADVEVFLHHKLGGGGGGGGRQKEEENMMVWRLFLALSGHLSFAKQWASAGFP